MRLSCGKFGFEKNGSVERYGSTLGSGNTSLMKDRIDKTKFEFKYSLGRINLYFHGYRESKT
ncbi:hypothetical protein LPTSP3_g26010 [Leptospira kobayashii]|uniref:Uncharacterized protein n=1 Tax=Leptospira kobayashii TaxID=1917830 RepID=A0ABN6KKH3_9LEPT|nr:hypothetical protein LPTSP3_g26010 [Leptospira kobayashii]